MDYLNVVWHEKEISPNRWRYVVATLLNEAIDNSGYEIHHRAGWDELPIGMDEAVVIVHGEHERHDVGRILAHLNLLKRAIVVVVADECELFPSKMFEAPNRRIWQQYAVPGHHNWCSHYLTCAYPIAIKQYANLKRDVRELDWFFSGQLTHGRRHMCVNALRSMQTRSDWRGELHTTPGFWQGMEHADYYRLMGDARVIPCPSGPATPDSIRVFEALEMGCVPIVDGTCPRYSTRGYWNYVFRQPPPFPVIDNWNDLPTVMAIVLQDWERHRDACRDWFSWYKQEMASWVRKDLEELRNV